MIYSREIAVGIIAGGLITFTAWAWGGVVLWTQWVTAGFGLLALVVALLPSTGTKWQSRSVRYRIALATAGGIGVLVFSLVRRLLEISETREATLQLIPNAELPPLPFSDWGETPLLIGLGTTLFLGLLTGLLRPSGARRRLVRFWPFWLGLFLFAWIACQSLNPWGKVIQRDLYWHIVPQDYITWLPSGLDAPFASAEEPGGMNGWRQLLIFVGPWALLCALTISIQRRRIFAWLAAIACLNGLGVALAGNLARLNKWRDFLGISDPDLGGAPFGPFVYKNHAGAYLYLVAALTLALMFYLAKRRGEKADRGGPHLIAALGAVTLVLGSASTLSIGAATISAVLLLVITPLAYFSDRQLRTNLSAVPLVAMVALTGVVAYTGLVSTDARVWRHKVGIKQQRMEQRGDDDRAPLRRASWLMVETASLDRQLSGWGGGSYRWASPSYMATQPEFLNRGGNLSSRATHAHNDWIQAVVEWGIAGWITILGAAGFIAALAWPLVSSPRAASTVLLGALVLFAAHAFLDFLLFIPHLSAVALLVAWLKIPNSELSRNP